MANHKDARGLLLRKMAVLERLRTLSVSRPKQGLNRRVVMVYSL
jgi:hypothetical protein